MSSSRQIWNHNELRWEVNKRAEDYKDPVSGKRPIPPTDELDKKVLLTKVVRELVKKGKGHITKSYVHKGMSKEGYSKDAIDTIWANYKDDIVSEIFHPVNVDAYKLLWKIETKKLDELKKICEGDWPLAPVKPVRRRTPASVNNAYLRQQLRMAMKGKSKKEQEPYKARLEAIRQREEKEL
jgi:hypothetical protein